ncbi:MAG: bifunctional DedA family/phosphatase PAP2 family protein [Thermoleophilaceae bacterium]
MSAGQITAAVAAVALVAIAVWRRRHTALLLVAAAALGVYAGGLLDLLPDPEKAIEDLATALGQWTYLLVGGLAFLETGAFVGLVAPGETAVIAGGVIAGQGEIELVLLIGIVWGGAVLGDTTSFFVGRRLGRGFVLRHGPRMKITRERLEQVEDYFDRHGGKTILIGRFVGLVRALAPFIAGSSRMRYRRFLPYSVLGTGLWAATFCVLGYLFWRSFSRVTEIAGRATLAFGIVVGVVVGTVWAYRRLRHEEERDRMVAWIERQPLLRPLWQRVVRPAWRAALPRLRFARDRLTPGNLGIEFTTAIAVGVAGLYVFGGYAFLLESGTSLTTGDRLAFDVAGDMRAGWAVDLAKVFTELAASPVAGGLVLVAALLLLWRHKPLESVTLVSAFVLLWISVQAAKAGVDRPRPADGLIGTDGQSYPSGHAAYATTYVALALVAGRVLPNFASRAAFVGAMVGLATLLGLSRVYLRAHYWSDVAGGWGLGAGIFAACGAVALIVTHVRHNGRVPAPTDHG